MMAASLVTPDQARDKARSFYDRHGKEWAARLYLCAINLLDQPERPALSIPLHPPTESEVLQNPRRARLWVESWRKHPGRDNIRWVSRSWPSVGSQSIPERIDLNEESAIAAFGGRMRAWKTLHDRTLQLAKRASLPWRSARDIGEVALLLPALRKAAGAYEVLPESDWNRLLLMLDWLIEHPATSCYARELPIRGIDTKWFERHRKAVSLVHIALTGSPCTSILVKPPTQVRARFLDDSLAPGGLRALSATPAEFNRYTGQPRAVIICENLVSVMALPSLLGTVALHGGGYAVSELAAIEWLANTPVLYWGDLDSHGFAILNQWRHHHENTRSLMMDKETLAAHRDLCVQEPTPSKAALDHLTCEEAATLHELSSSGTALRLEQERIEWVFAMKHIRSALEQVR